MRALKSAFQPLSLNAKDAEELVFHFADILDEFTQVATLLRRVARKKVCTLQEYGYLVSCISVHWAYHLPKIRRLLSSGNMGYQPPRHRRSKESKEVSC